MENKPTREEAERLVVELMKQPEFFASFSKLLAEVKGEQGGKLDDAEDRLITRLREIGGQALSSWAQETARHPPAPFAARKSSKKSPLSDHAGVGGG